MGDAVRDGDVHATGDPEATIDASQVPRASPAPAPPPADHARLPDIDRAHYAVLGELAKGGVGRVLEARDLRLGRDVAIKELLPRHRDAAARFEREARITARLQHPAIIQVYEAGTWPGGEPFYAMPRVAGRSLDKVVAERATLVERLGLVPNVIAVAEALAYAHSEHVIHRDLKPANVLVGEFGQTVVIDWGLAKDLGAPADAGDSLTAAFCPGPEETVSGSILGTPAYMPPEQARGEPVDQRADVYAIGALLYKVLAGEAPYTGATARHVIDQVQAGPPVPLPDREPGTPPELAAIVAQAMARAPQARYATAGELAKDLERFQTGQLVAAHRYTTRQLVWRFVRRNRLALAVGAIALAALAIGATVSVRRILAEKARTEAKRLALLEERGRSELLAEHPGPALVYLVHAAGDRTPDPALAFLLEEAMRPFRAERATLAAGSGMVSLAVSADGTQLATGADAVTTWDVAHGRAGLAARPSGRVTALAWDTAGAHLAAGTEDGSAWIWTPGRTSPPLVLRGHRGAIHDVAFSQDGQRLVTAGDDGTARVWNVATGALVAISRCHTAPVLSARFSPDGDRVATGSEDATACVWEAATGNPVTPLGGHTGAVRSVRWSADGTRVLTASDDGTALLWDAEQGKPVARPFRHRKAVVAAELFGDGAHVLTASADHTAVVWELRPGEDGSLPAPISVVQLATGDAIVKVAIDARGRRIATAALDGVAKVWDAATGQPIASFEHANGLASIAFAGDDRLVTGDLAGNAHVWNIGGRFSHAPRDLESQIAALDAADGWIAAGTLDSVVTVWRSGGGAALERRDHQGRVLAVALAHDARGTTLVSAGVDAEAIVWDVAGDRVTPRCRLASHGDEPTRALAAAGGVIARALPDAIELWSSADCGRLATVAARPTAIALAADGQQLVAGDDQGQVVVWSAQLAGWAAAPPRPLATIAGPVGALAFSPGGRRLLVGGNGIAQELEVASGREGATLDGPFGDVTAVAWLDGARVVTANSEGLATIWDAVKGKLLARRGVLGAAVTALAVEDGATLWLADDRGLVRSWPVERSTATAAERRALAARTGWVLGDDDVATRNRGH